MKLSDHVPSKTKLSLTTYNPLKVYIQIDYIDDTPQYWESIAGASVTDAKNALNKAEAKIKSELWNIRQVFVTGEYLSRDQGYMQEFLDINMKIRNREF